MCGCWKNGWTAGLQLGHISATKQETATPISCRVEWLMLMEMGVMRCMVLTALRPSGEDSELWMRECETEKKKLREDKRGRHEFRKSTECSGLSLHSLIHIDICLIDYSQQRVKAIFLLKTFVFVIVSTRADLFILPQEVYSFCRKYKPFSSSRNSLSGKLNCDKQRQILSTTNIIV
jgi:hypothetical protein